MRSDRVVQFGDFQTSQDLAGMVVSRLVSDGVKPDSIVEPTCGVGAFLGAAARAFADAAHLVGIEVNGEYVARAREYEPTADVRQASFFDLDWQAMLSTLPGHLLIIGNPPWVTSAGLSARGGSNVPVKSNLHGQRGIDAKTGKANFDIAEWIMIRLIEALGKRESTIAMLLKTSVARKVLRWCWASDASVVSARIHEFDASEHFGVSVDACLLVLATGPARCSLEAGVYESIDADVPHRLIAWREGRVVADIDAFERSRCVRVPDGGVAPLRWRSGVKHDASRIMELRGSEGDFTNGLGERVEVEADCVFPLMKGSDVAQERLSSRWMIVPQRRTGDHTTVLRESAPKTWAYLCEHGDSLDGRRSSIYRNRPRFSVFGVGEYTFRPWKVAICGLYKHLGFRVVGPVGERPVVFDDTVYFLSFDRERDARVVKNALQSELATRYFESSVFWDNKRAITAELLNGLDLVRLGEEVGVPIHASEPSLSLFT